LTEGEPEVVEVVPASGVDAERLVEMAAAVERGSEHPLARAILKRAEGQPLPEVRGFEAIPGHGPAPSSMARPFWSATAG
jgi:cation transport ATPase